MIPSYSRDGLAARIEFFRPYNQVTFIVEDTDDEIFYETLLGRVFAGKFEVAKVLGLGGKQEVIEEFDRSIREGFTDEIFITDGDYDELLGIMAPDHPRFCRLHLYDIENYLVDLEAICDIAEEELPVARAASYRDTIEGDRWQSAAVDVLWPVVACEVALKKIGSGTKFQSVQRFLSRGKPDKVKVTAYVEALSRTQPSRFRSALREVRADAGRARSARARWISGKRVWIPLVAAWLQVHTKHALSHDSLRIRLAKKCDIARFDDLVARVAAAFEA